VIPSRIFGYARGAGARGTNPRAPVRWGMDVGGLERLFATLAPAAAPGPAAEGAEERAQRAASAGPRHADIGEHVGGDAEVAERLVRRAERAGVHRGAALHVLAEAHAERVGHAGADLAEQVQRCVVDDGAGGLLGDAHDGQLVAASLEPEHDAAGASRTAAWAGVLEELDELAPVLGLEAGRDLLGGGGLEVEDQALGVVLRRRLVLRELLQLELEQQRRGRVHDRGGELVDVEVELRRVGHLALDLVLHQDGDAAVVVRQLDEVRLDDVDRAALGGRLVRQDVGQLAVEGVGDEGVAQAVGRVQYARQLFAGEAVGLDRDRQGGHATVGGQRIGALELDELLHSLGTRRAVGGDGGGHYGDLLRSVDW
jgi:hypothetical protein